MQRPSIIALDAGARLERWPDYSAAEVAAGSPAQKGQWWVDDKIHGLSAGIWEAEANTWHMIDYPVHEFMLILEGEVEIVEKEQVSTFRAGDSFVVPKGLHCAWRQRGYVRKVFVIFDDRSGVRAGPPPRLVKIDPQGTLAPSKPPLADMLLSPAPTQHARDDFVDATAQMTVGVWDTTGYERKMVNFARHELMHLLEGSVTLTEDDGRQRTFRAGDTFFVPLGSRNAWKSEGYLRKIYCIFQPK